MAKVTRNLQVTIPKALADRCGIQAGDDVVCSAAGDGIRITSAHAKQSALTLESRLALFDAATRRQETRQRGRTMRIADSSSKWKREDLYTRGRTR